MTAQTDPPIDEAAYGSALREALSEFGEAVKAKLAGPGQDEDQMRSPLENLLQRVAGALATELVLHGEASLVDLRVRPDFAAWVNRALCGYIEVKKPGTGVDPEGWRAGTHNRRQWEKLRLLPNVMYTDGKSWALYRQGERVGDIVNLVGDVRTAGKDLTVADNGLARIFAEFLSWDPVAPRTIRQLVNSVAGLCRLLRDEVSDLMDDEIADAADAGPFHRLADDWRKALFPDADDAQFVDGYAQTVTFALLLARVEGIDFTGRHISEIARLLGKSHSLMGKALAVLTDDSLGRLAVTLDTLTRVVGAVDWSKLDDGTGDPYLRLYEDFLAVYDAKLRKETGSYYTPPEIVSSMTRLVDELLRTQLGQTGGFVSENVVIVDPAMGTGAYLLDVIERAASTVADDEGPGSVPGRLRELASRLIGFEKQTGPYAVAELRASEALRRHGAEVPAGGMRMYVADTLSDPYAEVESLASIYEPITRSRRAANKVKRDERVMVCLGNPPYRDKAGGMGGWVEDGSPQRRAPLDDFRAPGNGRHEYVMSNLYVYFWRWATWKVFDAHPEAPVGVVAFITTDGFLIGPGFAGMREYLRRSTDEGWIIGLSPEGHQPPVSTRVFPGVQQELCIAIFIRKGETDPETPSNIHHLSLTGRRKGKLAALAKLQLDDPNWTPTATAWQAPLRPAGGAAWVSYPALVDLFPWATTGMTTNRNWVTSPDPETLKQRWNALISAPETAKSELMKETRDRTLTKTPTPLPGATARKVPLADEQGPCPEPVRVAYRSLDRHWRIPDERVIDFPRTALWEAQSNAQVYITEQHSQPLGAGPGLSFAAALPDVHHFNGRGGRALPLFRDASALQPNLAPGLLTLLKATYGADVDAEDVLAYVAAVVGHTGYTALFTEELKTPGVRVPLTADPSLFSEAVELGREVLWLHTYGERFTETGRPAGPPRLTVDPPKVLAPIPDCADEMPEDIAYNADTEILRVGAGKIGPVPASVWEYQIGGISIIRKWFGYRRRDRAGEVTSPLDHINPSRWLPAFTTELLNLLHVIGRLVQLEPTQMALLDKVCAGMGIDVAALTEAGVLPVPTAAKKPAKSSTPKGAEGIEKMF